MGRAYEGDQTRLLALELGYIPVVPPKTSRLEPWEYDRAMYNKRNEIERLFRLLKEFRRIYSQDRQTGCPLSLIYPFRPYCRSTQVVLTGPSLSNLR